MSGCTWESFPAQAPSDSAVCSDNVSEGGILPGSGIGLNNIFSTLPVSIDGIELNTSVLTSPVSIRAAGCLNAASPVSAGGGVGIKAVLSAP